MCFRTLSSLLPPLSRLPPLRFPHPHHTPPSSGLLQTASISAPRRDRRIRDSFVQPALAGAPPTSTPPPPPPSSPSLTSAVSPPLSFAQLVRGDGTPRMRDLKPPPPHDPVPPHARASVARPPPRAAVDGRFVKAPSRTPSARSGRPPCCGACTATAARGGGQRRWAWRRWCCRGDPTALCATCQPARCSASWATRPTTSGPSAEWLTRTSSSRASRASTGRR